jgi:hemoglobin/transferrin/lactoferrin receptor protein
MKRLFLSTLFLLSTFLVHAQLLSGRVTDATTGQPVVSATVRVADSRVVTTDARGRYQVPLPGAGTFALAVSSVGYEPTEVQVWAEGTQEVPFDLALLPATIQLNDQVVVTAQRYRTTGFDRPEALTVLSRQDLERGAQRSVPEQLMGQAGVFVQKTNHGGGSPFLRGLTGQQTLLLVDGIRLNNATYRSGPNQYLATLDPFPVERLEVLRGGGSVAYGTDALGGTINVLTHTPQFSERRQLTGTTLGKYTSGGMEQSGRLALGVSTSKLAMIGGFSYRNFGDLWGGKGIGKQSPTGYEQWSADLKARWQLSQRLLLTVAYQQLQQDSVPVYHKVLLENFAVNQFDPQKRMHSYARLEGAGASPWLNGWQLTVLGQQTAEGRQSRKNGSAVTTYERDEVYTKGALASFTSAPTAWWQVQTGADWYYDQVRSRRRAYNPASSAPSPDQRGLYPDGATLSNLAFYSLHTLTFPRLTLTGGGRYNTFVSTIPDIDLGTVQMTPSAWVGNLGASYALWPSLRLTAGVNSTFRAPNIDDLGTLGIVDFRFEVPNNQLRPERGLNKELGLKLHRPRFASSLAVFHNQLTDMIGRVKTEEVRQGYPVFLKQNISTAFIRGLEAEAEAQLARRWVAGGNLTYTYGQNTFANEPFRRIPPLNGQLHLRYQHPGGLWARAEGWAAAQQDRLAKGDRDDNRIPAGGTPGWKVLNLAGGYGWRGVRLSAELQNLFNEAYRTHGSGVSGVGRSLWLQLRYDW